MSARVGALAARVAPRAARGLAALGTAGALCAAAAAPTGTASAAPLVSIPALGGSSSEAPLLTVSTPGSGSSREPLITVSAPGTSSSSPPLLSVGTPSVSQGGQLVGVEVAGKPVVNVPAPSLPAGEAPSLPETPSLPTPSGPSGSPPPGSSGSGSHGGSPSAGGSGGPSAAASSSGGAGSSSPAASPGSAPASGAGAPHATQRAGARTGSAAHARRARGTGTGADAGASASAATRLTRNAAGTGGASRGHSSSDPLAVIGSAIPLPLPVPDWSKPIILALLLVALALGVRARVASRRARRLEIQRAALSDDVAAMQAALVPEVPGGLRGARVSVAYRPAEGPAAGGDFYDVLEPSEGRIAVIVGDVAGHGRDALTHAALARYTLRAYVQAGLEPRAALALAGRALADPSCEHLTTVAVAEYDAGRATLTYALAGHPAPIVRGAGVREPVIVCCSPPIGWIEPTGRRQRTISLPAGTEAWFFTDGLTEARCAGEAEDGLLGRERLADILGSLASSPSASDLLAAVRAATRATPDDMAACVIAPSGAVRAERLDVEELEADPRALEAGHVAEFLAACGVPRAETARAVELAASTAALHESAVLRVECHLSPARVTVAAPSLAPEDSEGLGGARLAELTAT